MNLTKLKTIPRSGWLSHNVSLPDIESVADHTFSMSVLSMVMADLELERGVKVNIERVLRMALLHDLAESLTFDISRAYLDYMGTRGGEMKREIERNAWEHVVKGIEDRKMARLYRNAQKEYVENKTREAKIVHAADSIDILLQVASYRRRGYPESLMSDLWKEQFKLTRRSNIPSTKAVLRLIVGESKNLVSIGKVK
jgi:putative hydrolase of HD superfamily